MCLQTTEMKSHFRNKIRHGMKKYSVYLRISSRDETSRILFRDEIWFERKPLIEYI